MILLYGGVIGLLINVIGTAIYEKNKYVSVVLFFVSFSCYLGAVVHFIKYNLAFEINILIALLFVFGISGIAAKYIKEAIDHTLKAKNTKIIY
jgi:uncharacterized membrane protein